MSNYENAKIYKLYSLSEPSLVYYGSTTNSLSKRMTQHKHSFNENRKITSKLIFKNNDEVIELVEEFPCNSKTELRIREGYYIQNNICVNIRQAGRTSKEYYIDNKEKLKDYYENNKDKKKENQKLYREKNNEIIKERKKQYQNDNKEKIKGYGKKYREENNQIIRERKKQYYEKNKERIKEQMKQYRENKKK